MTWLTKELTLMGIPVSLAIIGGMVYLFTKILEILK